MRSPLQEKIQITVRAPEEPADSWVDQSTSRQSQTNVPGGHGDKLNFLPPGMDLSNQKSSEIHNMPLVMSGTSDVSADTNPEAFDKGFTRKQMGGTDDQYTGEHVDHFYGDAGGFVERNNYLDRI